MEGRKDGKKTRGTKGRREGQSKESRDGERDKEDKRGGGWMEGGNVGGEGWMESGGERERMDVGKNPAKDEGEREEISH